MSCYRKKYQRFSFDNSRVIIISKSLNKSPRYIRINVGRHSRYLRMHHLIIQRYTRRYNRSNLRVWNAKNSWRKKGYTVRSLLNTVCQCTWVFSLTLIHTTTHLEGNVNRVQGPCIEINCIIESFMKKCPNYLQNTCRYVYLCSTHANHKQEKGYSFFTIEVIYSFVLINGMHRDIPNNVISFMTMTFCPRK